MSLVYSDSGNVTEYLTAVILALSNAKRKNCGLEDAEKVCFA